MLVCFLLVYYSWLVCGLTFTSWLAPGPACPSSPGLAPGLVLCFTWPPKCFAGCDFWCFAVAVEEQWCSWCGLVLWIRTVVSLNLCWSNALLTPLGAPHLVDGLVLLATVVLPTHHCMQWLCCLSCLSPNLLSSTLWPCCALLWAQWTCTQWVYEQMLHLIIYTQWCNGNGFALVWE
jgi:hypothetical protein